MKKAIFTLLLVFVWVGINAQTRWFVDENQVILPSYTLDGSRYDAETWVIYGTGFNTESISYGTPPEDAAGKPWYATDYKLTDSPADKLPDGTEVKWKVLQAPFGSDFEGGVQYFPDDGTGGDIYIRRSFTSKAVSDDAPLTLFCSYDDLTVQVYLNGTLIYSDEGVGDDRKLVDISEYRNLLKTDGSENVIAAHSWQAYGPYRIDFGLYSGTPLTYELIDDSTCRTINEVHSYMISGAVEIPSSVTYEGKNYTVTEIGDNSFNGAKITSVSIPATVTTIGNSAFDNCQNLESLVLPENLKKIMNEAFARSGLRQIEVPLAVDYIGEGAFSACHYLVSVVLPDSIAVIERNLFSWCNSLRTIHLPGAVNEIGENAFQYSGLTSIDIPASVKKIGTNAFANCYRLRTVTGCEGLQPDLMKDEYGIFAYSGLTTPMYAANIFMYMPSSWRGAYVMPEGVEIILQGSFYDCDELTALILPSTLVSLQGWAMDGLWRLETLTCRSLTPPTCVEVYGTSGLNGLNAETLVVYVPAESVDKYKAADYWKDFQIFPIASDIVTFKVDPQGVDIAVTDTVRIKAFLEDGTPASVTWSSADDNIATVSEDGLVTAHTAGTVKIMAVSAQGYVQYCSVNVYQFAQTWILDMPSDTLRVGDVVELKAYTDINKDIVYTILSGEDCVTLVGNVLTCVKEGFVEIELYSAGNTEFAESYYYWSARIDDNSAIELIPIDDDTEVTVYDMKGTQVFSGKFSEIGRLERGVYIVRSATSTIKIIR
ncbi:MAG: leucine-rich repeat protein [Bacteroides sp.]|nr:leucine-rich repeat protein [Bacteroides sp.]